MDFPFERVDKVLSSTGLQRMKTELIRLQKILLSSNWPLGKWECETGCTQTCNGLIIALNAEAGITLMKCRINNYYGILPSVNEAGKKFWKIVVLHNSGFQRRMLMGKKSKTGR